MQFALDDEPRVCGNADNQDHIQKRLMFGGYQAFISGNFPAHFGFHAGDPAQRPAAIIRVCLDIGEHRLVGEKGKGQIYQRHKRHHDIHLDAEQQAAYPLDCVSHQVSSLKLRRAAVRVAQNATSAANGGMTKGNSQCQP